MLIFLLDRNLQRNFSESPLMLRLKSKFNKTKIGKFYLKSHLKWENYRNKYVLNWHYYMLEKPSLWFVCNTLPLFFFGTLYAYAFAIFFKIMRYDSIQNSTGPTEYFRDKVYFYLNSTKHQDYSHNILKWDLDNKIFKEKCDVLDYIQYGKIMAVALQEEIAFQCFYTAHLKDHQNIKTNGELEFSTYVSKIAEAD